jgi:hypothetical protein
MNNLFGNTWVTVQKFFKENFKIKQVNFKIKPLNFEISTVNFWALTAFLFFIATAYHTNAQITIDMTHYSTRYFGPNANPVPQFSDATIPQYATIEMSANYFYGFWGDHTYNGFFCAELPFISNRLSLKVWTTFAEYFETPFRVALYRNVVNEQQQGIAPIGDVYVQTRMSILAEREWRPAVILNITLKTASTTAEDFAARRYFDTPGYYFDVEIGKSLHFNSRILKELRLAVDMGFLCWETTESTQNDAVMGGVKIIAANPLLRLESSLGGYKGWMNDGDSPLVFTSRLMTVATLVAYFFEYRYGMRNFSYHHFQAGIQIPVKILTPKIQ